MQQLIECVPNFSEGRRKEVVDQIVAAISSVDGVTLLDQEMDASHNRSVITFVGDAQTVEEAAFCGCAKAAELIDLDVHRGEHPRMGATDVIPFIPISGASQQDCVNIARRLGERVGRELTIPVYLYEDAATKEANRNLADVRRGEYEGIKAEIETNPDRAPDFGPHTLGKAGAVAIGARCPLIAFNINLGTRDLNVAKAIAKAVRFSNGGLRYVKALGIELAERGMVQVSMNMTKYDETPLFRVFELVKREAERYGVHVVESEIVGLVPQQALLDVAQYYLQVANFSRAQVLEVRMADALAQQESTLSRNTFLDELAAPTPTPGGGSAAAYVGALAASLLVMYTGLTATKKSYQSVRSEMERIRSEAVQLKDQLNAAVEDDARAFEAVLHANKLPKDSAQRATAIHDAMRAAIEVPLRVAELSARVRELARQVMEHGLKSARSDVTVATYLAEAAVKGALLNVRENLSAITDEKFAAEYRARVVKVEAMI